MMLGNVLQDTHHPMLIAPAVEGFSIQLIPAVALFRQVGLKLKIQFNVGAGLQFCQRLLNPDLITVNDIVMQVLPVLHHRQFATGGITHNNGFIRLHFPGAELGCIQCQFQMGFPLHQLQVRGVTFQCYLNGNVQFPFGKRL